MEAKETARERRRRRFFAYLIVGLAAVSIFGAAFVFWPDLKPDKSEAPRVSLRLAEYDQGCEDARESLRPDLRELYQCVPVYYGTTNAARRTENQVLYVSDLKELNAKPVTHYGRAEILVLKRAVRSAPSESASDGDFDQKLDKQYGQRLTDTSAKYKITEVVPAAVAGAVSEEDISRCEASTFFGARSRDEVQNNNGGVECDAPEPRENLEDAAKRNNRSVFVFIHGMANSFDQAIAMTAQVALDTEMLRRVNIDSSLNTSPIPGGGCPHEAGEANASPTSSDVLLSSSTVDCFDLGQPVLFNWRNHENIWEYAEDKDLIENDEPGRALASFLTAIAREEGVDRINIMAHSMGNRVLVQGWHEFAANLAAMDDAPAVSIVHASAELTVSEYNDAYQRLKAASSGLVSPFSRTIYSSREDIMMYLAKMRDLEIGSIIDTASNIGAVRRARLAIRGGLANAAKALGFEATEQLILDVLGIGSSCRLGDITEDHCNVLTGEGVKDLRDAEAFEQADIIDTRSRWVGPETDLLISPAEIDQIKGYFGKLKYPIAKSFEASLNFAVDHNSAVAKSTVLTDVGCAFEQVPAVEEGDRSLHRKDSFWILEPGKKQSRCDPSFVVLEHRERPPAPPQIVNPNDDALYWPYRIPDPDAGETLSQALDGGSATANFASEIIVQLGNAYQDKRDLACGLSWIAVTGSASQEGDRLKNAARARTRARLGATAAREFVEGLSAEFGCEPPQVFGVNFGQHRCAELDACAPNDGLQTNLQRRVLFIVRERASVEHGDETPVSRDVARQELGQFVKLKRRQIILPEQVFEGAEIVDPY
ncbi:MAG: alpha/beta hydrolase [Parvularculaceae bacterium]